jgi:hypothetical protein
MYMVYVIFDNGDFQFIIVIIYQARLVIFLTKFYFPSRTGSSYCVDREQKYILVLYSS